MEPLNENELSELLRRWEAPVAPQSLEHRVLPRKASWRWLFTGTIRIPVPVGIAAVVLLALWLYSGMPSREPVTPAPTGVSLADFQPVRQLEPRIVTENNDESTKPQTK
jgi:hypothetical protein